eukprot:7464041-Pyramimonas_sp.AAC.2
MDTFGRFRRKCNCDADDAAEAALSLHASDATGLADVDRQVDIAKAVCSLQVWSGPGSTCRRLSTARQPVSLLCRTIILAMIGSLGLACGAV